MMNDPFMVDYLEKAYDKAKTESIKEEVNDLDLIGFRNPRPLGVVRVNWLCLDIAFKGVLEFSMARFPQTLLGIGNNSNVESSCTGSEDQFFHYSSTPLLQ